MLTAGLLLRAVEVADRWHWRWLLADERSGASLADHTVAVDPADPDAGAFADLYRYVRWNADPDRRAESEASIVDRVGAWAGEHILGTPIGEAIAAAAPVTVRVEAPDFLLSAPLELAHVGGVALARRGDVSLVFDVGGSPSRPATPADRLRMVAVFSHPTESTALGLRRERYQLTRFVRGLAARSRRMIELEVLQYGVTRDVLAERMTAGGGPDVLHLSGHGRTGVVLLETGDGRQDPVTTDELLELLRPGRQRLRLAVLSACESAAAATAETLRWLKLDEAAEHAQAAANAEAAAPPVTGMARELAQKLGCAVLAMRYPVLDEFAIGLTSSLYNGLFALDLPVDEALRRAVPPAAAHFPGLSAATPTLLGANAIGMSLKPPRGKPDFDPDEARMAGFPEEPVRFVGRARTMARSSRALAPGNGQSGVLFHGMAGAGKTSCALELAYRHQERFTQHVWWQAPQREDEWPVALTTLATAWEARLADYGFAMVDKIGTEAQLQRFLPKLQALLKQQGLLLVLDNLETLLTPTGQWRDPRWAQLIEALTTHGGESRVVLTSRIRPADLSPTVDVEQVHSLSRDETILLARELPNLRNLLHTDPGPSREIAEANRATVRRVLHLVQGHPKLLELADAAAANPDTLAAQLAAAEDTTNDQALSAFFTRGQSTLDDSGFLEALAGWTRTTLSTLPAASQLLMQVLAGIEPNDRWSSVLKGNWVDVCRRLKVEPSDLTDALTPLTTAALIDPDPMEDVVYRMHPGIAETIRATTPSPVRDTIDTELGAFWYTVAVQAIEREGGEHTPTIVHAGLAAAPYLLRQHEWDTASYLIGQAVTRDSTIAVAQLATAHLRRIASATGTPEDLTKLGRATARIDPVEGQRLLHIALEHALATGGHFLASGVAMELVDLLRRSGRLHEALAMSDRHADLARQARLGPWTQLASQVMRLQILRHMGQTEFVLAEVRRLVDQMVHLPDQSAENDPVIAWNVRETILNIGAVAAKDLERWDEALDFNAQNLASKRARGAGEHSIASHHFNDYFPLLRLGRLAAAEQLLLACQQVYEDHHDISGIARAFAARAELANARGHHRDAINLIGTALRYLYSRPSPRDIGSSHYNLAVYLHNAGTDPTGQVAHRLAAAIIGHLTGQAANLAVIVGALAEDIRVLTPPTTIGEVAAIVGQVEGVRFAEMVAALPGDAQEGLDAVLDAARRQSMGA